MAKSILRLIGPLCGPAQWMDDSPTNIENGIDSRKNVRIYCWMVDGPKLEFQPPSRLTRDHNFLGQWFQTMCGRLGILEAFSQVYHPHANGRAEVAGQQLI